MIFDTIREGSKVKKDLFVISTLNTGGAQKILSNMVTALPEDFESTILLNDDENIVYPYKGKIISLGFKPQKNKLNVFYMLRVLIKRFSTLKKLKNTGEYCACISFLDSANIANVLSGGKKCKTILTVHNTLSKTKKSLKHRFILFPLIKLLYGKAYKVVAVSEGIKYDLINFFKLKPDNVITILNGHDLSTIRSKGKIGTKKYSENEYVFCNVGRLSYAKGQWYLIRAFKEVLKTCPNCRLVFLGEGEYRDYLEKLAFALGIKDKVDFPGFLENPYEIIASCDAYVHSALHEGFPNALIEALALSKPCIATDFRSGAREILAPFLPVSEEEKDNILKCEYGIITPVCDGKKYLESDPLTFEEELLSKAMIMMATDTDIQKQYIEKSNEAVCNLDISRIIEKWVDLI